MQKTPNSQINKSYLLVHKAGIHSEECKACDRRPAAEAIWLNFCIQFYQSYDYVRNSKIDPVQDGFNNSNVIVQQETTEAINKLSNPVSSDSKTI